MGRAFEVRKAAMAKTNAVKTKIYARFGKEIYMAARAGVPDPEMNQGLKQIIAKAKANQVTAEVIKRAIDKAKGGSDESYTSVRYEGFGPNNSNIIVECLTDNVNRTVSEVRTCFTKSKSKMGVSGSVSHMFDSVGILSFKYTDDGAMLDCLVEHDVDVQDIEVEEDIMTVTVVPTSLYAAKTAVESLIPEVEFDVLENTMIPQNMVSVEGEDKEMFDRLLSMLDNIDDVQNVYHNVEE
ncbi:MAG: YebC/PmpR family DNA-binding transcriptional regulator [Erysipelotrichaceae bacterium]|jgi:YebC/PmpR family DNA-binding regulatory protein|nr:YebC/PmpR family DNA-binding transcriptional regulator [Erysipelotrichaceae bacterium]